MEGGDGVMAIFDGGSTSQRDEYLLEPKHAIFLSHSGAQKSFVDQLCLDIERHDRYPFFDKRRNCLSIGCNFPDLIFEAINQCQVAVVVLSEEFFSRSKWPLLELAALVKRKSWDPKLIIMPVFLGLTHAQCRDKLNHDRWMRVWQGWAEVDSRIDLREWQAALKVFGYTNGISLNEMMDEVKCRGEIVQAVCKEVLPRIRWDDSHVQGRSRLSMAIRVKIDGMQVLKNYGARILGVYGVGGIGKTTACKVLCNDYFEEFEGKVCLVEFGVGNKFSMLQEILKRLTETNQEVMKNFSEDECKDRIKKGLKKKLFLAIDNVSPTQNTFDEARELLRMEFMQGSIVIVTARSISQLQNVNVEECMEMPELDEGEARALFLYHAVPRSYSEIAHEMSEHLLKQCVERCYFRKGDYGNSCHYHPLALKVLGGQLGSEPNEWVDKLNELDPFNLWDEKEEEHPIFSILGRSFDLLKVDDQVLFMDAAIFFPKHHCSRVFPINYNVLRWLSMVHGKSLHVIKGKLERLKSKSLLENVGDGSEEIGMHDLWREFAIMKSKGGEFDSRPWIYEKIYRPNDSRREEPKLVGSGGWENLQRICLVGDTERGCTVKEIDLGWYSNLRVLKLVDVYTNTKILDVSALTQLRSLQILYSHEALEIDLLGLGCLRSLVFLDLYRMQVTKASLPEEIGGLTSLQALSIRRILWRIPVSILLDFSRLNLLRDVHVENTYKVDKITPVGLSSTMTNLKCLQLSGCSSLRSCHGVGDLVALEELDLSWCIKLKELPDLGRLKHLLKLNIFSCKLIKVVSGLGDLVSLQECTASRCSNLAELPKMCKLFNLQRLWVFGCPLLKTIPGLSDLVALELLDADSVGLEGCHDLRKLTKLERVAVNGRGAEGLPCLADLVNLESLTIYSAVELTGLLDLTRIERLNLSYCRFARLPDLHKLPRLEELLIELCNSWTEWNIGSGLRLFGADLHIAGTFLHLKTLDLRSVALTQLPDLSSFPQLSELSLGWCKKLTSLTSSAPLTALKRLGLIGCERLRALPDVSHLVSLSTLRLHDCGELKLTAHEMEKLQTMCPGLKLDISFTEPEHDDEIDSDVESEPDYNTHSDMEPELDDEGDSQMEPELDDVRDAKRPKFFELI